MGEADRFPTIRTTHASEPRALYLAWRAKCLLTHSLSCVTASDPASDSLSLTRAHTSPTMTRLNGQVVPHCTLRAIEHNAVHDKPNGNRTRVNDGRRTADRVLCAR